MKGSTDVLIGFCAVFFEVDTDGSTARTGSGFSENEAGAVCVFEDVALVFAD